VLKSVDRPDLKPPPDAILIQTRAAAVNTVDAGIRGSRTARADS
jgi:NADPH:quinone reductase-like Zn-dependent oxidoreductase